MTERMPFRSELVDAGFERLGKPMGKIWYLRDDPEVIVRGSFVGVYEGKIKNYWYREQLDNRDILNGLRKNHGIAVPNFHIVVGGNRRFYIVTQRIHGPNLHEKKFKDDEVSEAIEKLSRLYTSLTNILIDNCDNGGNIIIDLVGAEGGTSGNKQWVYGRRKGDLEDQAWLVDLGPAIYQVSPQEWLLFQEQFPSLFRMITESETKLGCRFTEAREKLLGYLRRIRKEAGDNDLRSREIDFFFQTMRLT